MDDPDRKSWTIGDVVDLARGSTYKGSLLGQPGATLLGLSTIRRHGGFKRDGAQTYGGDSPERITLRPGDIYASLKDVTQAAEVLGSVARVPESVEAGRLTQDTVKLIPKGWDYPMDLLYWVLRTPEYRQFCWRFAIGTTTAALPREDFLAYRLPPPTEDRVTLARGLQAIEDRIEQLSVLNATLDELARTIFRSWFVDFDPVHAKAEDRAPFGMDAETAALFPNRFTDSELGPIPEGWKQSNVGAEFHVTMGQSPPSSTYNELGNGLPFYQGRADFGFRFPSERVFCTAPTRHASEGDTLLSVRAPVGDTNVAIADCVIGRGVAALRHSSGSISTTYHTIRSLGDRLTRFNDEGTVFGAINQRDLKALEVVVSSNQILRAFENIVIPMDSLVRANEIESRTLADLCDTLLPELISGRIRLADVAPPV